MRNTFYITTKDGKEIKIQGGQYFTGFGDKLEIWDEYSHTIAHYKLDDIAGWRVVENKKERMK